MKKMWKGNHAIAEAALRAGCQFYAGYPITPQTEVGEYLSSRMPELGRTFLQAENEMSAVYMKMCIRDRYPYDPRSLRPLRNGRPISGVLFSSSEDLASR